MSVASDPPPAGRVTACPAKSSWRASWWGSIHKDGKTDTGAEAKMMTELQGAMQAETRMFKMAQEAATTIVKSVGEALSSTARKQ